MLYNYFEALIVQKINSRIETEVEKKKKSPLFQNGKTKGMSIKTQHDKRVFTKRLFKKTNEKI